MTSLDILVAIFPEMIGEENQFPCPGGELLQYEPIDDQVDDLSQQFLGDLGKIVRGYGGRAYRPVVLPCLAKASVLVLTIHLNDSHLWTREKIADWMESLDLDLSFPTEGVK